MVTLLIGAGLIILGIMVIAHDRRTTFKWPLALLRVTNLAHWADPRLAG